jgi:hypothetical protein
MELSKLEFYIVVQDCLAYWSTPEEDEDGWDVQIGDLDRETIVHENTIYLLKDLAQAKADGLNAARLTEGATNERWDYRVETIVVQ